MKYDKNSVWVVCRNFILLDRFYIPRELADKKVRITKRDKVGVYITDDLLEGKSKNSWKIPIQHLTVLLRPLKGKIR